jgi:dTDP-4-dehydrorhamnose 3,5-epimerase
MMNGSEFETPKGKRLVDKRGWLQELGRGDFKQVNWSHNVVGVLRGLHYAPYSKLVTCIRGRIFDVAVDCRLDSPTLGKVNTVVLSSDGVAQAFIPEHFAHGFLALQDSEVVYLQSEEWFDNEMTINYRDPSLSVSWPINQLRDPLLLSDKDTAGLDWKTFLKNLGDLRLLKSTE